jgi:hypothetical protein
VQPERADVAQLVEQLIRNQQVIGSSPIVGSNLPYKFERFLSLFLTVFLSIPNLATISGETTVR